MMPLILSRACKARWLASLIVLLGMSGGAAGVQIANDFTITNRANNQQLHLADFAGKILVLDFFAYWCSWCKVSSPKLEIYVQQYYAAHGGNPHGVPVQVVAVEGDNSNPALTASFVTNAGIDFSANDGPGAYNQFGDGSFPVFVIINCVADSPTHAQHQVLYSQIGVDTAELDSWTTFKYYIDSVLPPPPGRTITWTGSADANWASAGNWNAPPVPGAEDHAIFNNAGGAARTLNLGTGVTIGSIVFDTAAAGAFTLGAGPVNSQALTLGNAGIITLNSTVTNSQSLNAALILGTDGSAQTFSLTNNSGAGLTVAGNLTGSSGPGTKILAVAGAGNTTLSGVIANGAAGTLGITKSGAGTLRMTAANTYTAATTVSSGVLKAGIASVPNVSGAFGRNSAVTLGNAAGCSLDITGYNTQVGSLAGGGSQGGNVTLGSATLTVGGNNTNTYFYGGISSNAGVTGVSLCKTGTGKLTLQGATVTSNTYSGKTVIDGGTLAPRWEANSNAGSATTDGGAVRMLGATPATFQADNLTIRNGGTLYIMSGAYDDIGNVSQNRGIYLEAGTQNILTQNGDVHIFSVISGPGGLSHGNTGSGGYRRLFLNAPNTFTGDTRFDGTGSSAAYGGIELVHPLALQNSAFDTSSAGSNLGFGGNASVTLGGLVNGGNLAAPSSVTTLTLNPTLAGITKTYSGVLSGSKMALIKTGDGTQELSGANSYTGNTTVATGKLLVNNTSGSGTSSGTVTVSPGATLGGTGSIAGSVNVSGVLAPGASIESLASGNLALLNGSTFACEVNSGAAPSVAADLQKVAGNLLLTGTVNLTLTDIAVAKAAFPLGTTLSLVNYTGTWNSGLFTYNSVALADGTQFTAGLNTWQISYAATTGGANFTGDYAAGHFVNLKAVAGLTPFEAWAAAAGLGTGDLGPARDPDHDGAANVAEFAFKGVPTAASSKGLLFTTTTDNTVDPDTARELTFTCAVRRSAGVNFTASNGAQTATIDGVTYTIEAGTTLTGVWNSPVAYIGKSDSPPAGSGLPGLTGTEWEYRTFSAFNGLPGTGFIRANVSIASTPTPFEAWIDSYTSIPAANRDPQYDPDHDGANNLAEFAFMGVPNAASSKGLLFTSIKDNNADSAKELTLTFTCAVRRSAGVNFTASNGAQTATIDGVTYTIEAGTTLTGPWNSPVTCVGKSDSPPAGSGLPGLTGTGWEYRTFSAFNGLPGTGFIRARVSLP